MKRVVCYVTDETHDRLHILRRREQRSMSQIAAGIITAALSDVNGEHGWGDEDALAADRGSGTAGADGPDSDGGAGGSSSPHPRRPGPVERAMARRRAEG